MPEVGLNIPGVGDLLAYEEGGRHAQGVWQKARPTYLAYAEGPFASAKHHITLFNHPGSGKIVKVRKLFATNLQITTFAGAAVRLNVVNFEGAPTTAGTSITPRKVDDRNADLPVSGTSPLITVRSGASVPTGDIWFPWVTSSAAETAAVALSKGVFQQSVNILPEGAELQEATLEENEGLTVQQVGTHAGGMFGWLMVFTAE